MQGFTNSFEFFRGVEKGVGYEYYSHLTCVMRHLHQIYTDSIQRVSNQLQIC